MHRLACAAALLGAFMASYPSNAQEAKDVRRIGWLWGGQVNPAGVEIVQSELRERGWVEGQNIIFEHRAAEARNERLAPLAAELVGLGVSVILTSQSPSTLAAKEATRSIPIVMVGNGDPVRYGLVTNLARPEANVTGVSFLVNEMAGKLVELLKQVNPDLSRLAVFVNPTNPGGAPYAEAAQAAAGALGVETLLLEVSKLDDFESAFELILRERADTLLLPPEGLIGSQRKRIAEFAAQNRLVVGGNHRAFVSAGAVISYSPDWSELARRAAAFVDRILRGAKPADLPVERPASFELFVNLKTAKELGLSIPPAVLLLATNVIR